MKRIVLLFVTLSFSHNLVISQTESSSNLSSPSEGNSNYNGFFDFKYEESKDAVFLTVKKLNYEFLYVNSLSSGIGNNDIGLDRGQLGNERIVYFSKSGNKLMLIQPNLKYRSTSKNYLEERSINEAFAKSVLFGFPIIESSSSGYIIDLTPFLLQDAHGVSKRLDKLGEGEYRIDPTRSSVYLPRTKAFPKNNEFDMMLTFTGSASGSLISSVTPSPDYVTIHQHHSFVELPDSSYSPRDFDPRSGANAMTFYDYSTPINNQTKKQYIYRHRLEKKNPEASISEAKEPIIYYLDNGTPEPVRSALLEGGRWWNQAFESIGFKDAFQVKILPNEADPLDVRYNVIQWVHRSTRGWSYGSSVADPRTGEIIKGHVSLGSLRVRQDFMIALGLLESPFSSNENKEKQAIDMALSRIRQLSAHEIGHTLGFAHNFTASSKSRNSVMDYPHPNIELQNDKISIKKAYEVGIGEWDKVSVAYSYSHFPKNINEKNALRNILNKSAEEGHHFISDHDARPIGGAHPWAHLWDNGSDVTNELSKLLIIREKALSNLSLDHLKVDAPYSKLEDIFVPIYLLHRYQSEAVVKLIAGVDYDYAVKGDQIYEVKEVEPIIQRNALMVYLDAMSPKSLSVPNKLRRLLPPRSFSNPRTRENFLSQTGVTFDYLGAANSLSDNLIKMLLHPNRANRLVTQYGFDSNQLSLKETLTMLVDNFFKVKYLNKHYEQLNEIIKANILKHIMFLGQHSDANSIVKSIVYSQLVGLDRWLSAQEEADFSEAHRFQINRYFDKPSDFIPPSVNRLPDGSPIGSFSCDF